MSEQDRTDLINAIFSEHAGVLAMPETLGPLKARLLAELEGAFFDGQDHSADVLEHMVAQARETNAQIDELAGDFKKLTEQKSDDLAERFGRDKLDIAKDAWVKGNEAGEKRGYDRGFAAGKKYVVNEAIRGLDALTSGPSIKGPVEPEEFDTLGAREQPEGYEPDAPTVEEIACCCDIAPVACQVHDPIRRHQLEKRQRRAAIAEQMVRPGVYVEEEFPMPPASEAVWQNECRLVFPYTGDSRVMEGHMGLTYDHETGCREIQVYVRSNDPDAQHEILKRLTEVPVRITIERVPGGNV